MKVLLVEDEKNTLNSYELALTANNHIVVSARDGKQALEKFKTEINHNKDTSVFDYTILDYKLPGLNGLEVAKKILEYNKDQKIIFATAFIEEMVKKNIESLLKNSDHIEYIVKPFDIIKLIEKLDSKIIAEELSKYKIKINPKIIKDNKEALKEIINDLSDINKEFLMRD